jgi:hypothetical protein
MKTPSEVATTKKAEMFTAVVIGALLVLTAWGNAIAMLAFSAFALAVWFVVPGLRGDTSVRRWLLVGAVTVASPNDLTVFSTDQLARQCKVTLGISADKKPRFRDENLPA